jgi:hypothetical protein
MKSKMIKVLGILIWACGYLFGAYLVYLCTMGFLYTVIGSQIMDSQNGVIPNWALLLCLLGFTYYLWSYFIYVTPYIAYRFGFLPKLKFTNKKEISHFTNISLRAKEYAAWIDQKLDTRFRDL